jgi:ribosomal protein S3
MGQKVNPIGLRLGINRTWDSRWFARKEYGNLLLDDLGLRKFLQRRLTQAGLSRVVIERAARRTRITLHSARPGVVIGKKGADIEKLRTDLTKVTNSEVSLNIVEIRKPEIDAKLIADGIAQQLERRVAFRRAMKRAVGDAARRARDPDQLFGPAGRSRDRPHGMVSRRPGAAAYIARRCRFRLRHRQDHLWRVRRQGLGLQGRDPRS